MHARDPHRHLVCRMNPSHMSPLPRHQTQQQTLRYVRNLGFGRQVDVRRPAPVTAGPSRVVAGSVVAGIHGRYGRFVAGERFGDFTAVSARLAAVRRRRADLVHVPLIWL